MTNYVKLECFQVLDCDDDYNRMICIPKGTKEKHLKDIHNFCDKVNVVSDNIDIIDVIAQLDKLETSIDQSPYSSSISEGSVLTRVKI